MSDLTAIAAAMRTDLEPHLDQLPDEPATRLACLMVAGALMIPLDRHDFDQAVIAARATLAGYAKAGRAHGPLPAIN